MYRRTLGPILAQSIEKWPIITLLGPRQSGKTTLCKMIFPSARYISLEDPDWRQQALTDPRGLLNGLGPLSIIDEIQRAPELLSYIQGISDQGLQKFILTGSHQLLLSEKISQTLAGRTRILELLPFSYQEMMDAEVSTKSWLTQDFLLNGGYPRILKEQMNPYEWLGQYIQSYLERDVRQIVNVGDLIVYEKFLKLSAGRVGQTLDYSQLGQDCGIKSPTAKSWISILCVSYVCFLLPPYFSNVNKRHIKTPKLYFHDTGLLCTLLGIRTKEHLETHPLIGFIFENFIVSEMYKKLKNQGSPTAFYFYRDQKKREIDLIEEHAQELKAYEIKWGQTFQTEWAQSMLFLQQQEKSKKIQSHLIYNGTQMPNYKNIEVNNWRNFL